MTAPDSKPNNSPAAPSGVRYAVVGVAMLMALLLYLDRFCISFAEIYIKEDLGLTDTQIGWMLGAFFLSYALAQVPSGWLSDRFGARNMLAIYILLWSLFTALTGMAGAFLAILLLRLGFGLGQAGAYPTSGNLVSKWVPFAARGAASSLITVGGRAGGALAPVLTFILMILFVPQSTSSLLTPRDLLDGPRLCRDLLQGNETTDSIAEASDATYQPLGKRIVASLSAEAQVEVLENGRRYALYDAAKKLAEKEKRRFDQPPPVMPDAAKTTIIAGLNQIVGDADFFTRDDKIGLSLPREAKQIRQRDPAEMDEAETERLNRLILESAYSESIRKVYGAGWRPVMIAYGLFGVLVAGVFWVVCRDRPADHPGVNQQELELIEHGRPPSAPSAHGKVGGAPMLALLCSRSMWLNCLMQWCTNVGWVFLVTWLPRYLATEHRVPFEARGVMAFIPLVVGWFGMLSGGWLTDRLVGLVGLRWGRALPMSLSRFAAMAAYLYCYFFEPSPWAAVAAFSIVAFSTDLGTGAVWAFMQDVGGKYVGSVLGWGNMFGNLGAAITPPLLILIVTESATWDLPPALAWLNSSAGEQNWPLAFLTCACAFLCSGLAALGVDATIPIAPKDEDEKPAK